VKGETSTTELVAAKTKVRLVSGSLSLPVPCLWALLRDCKRVLTYLNKLNGIPLNTPPRSDPLSLAGMCVSRVSCVARQVRSGPWWRGQQRCEMAARRPRGAGGGLRRGGTATTPNVPPDDGARSYSRDTDVGSGSGTYDATEKKSRPRLD
jgi:hypothetical protein